MHWLEDTAASSVQPQQFPNQLEISEFHVVDIALGALRTCSEHHAGLGFASKSEIESSETAL